MLTCNLPSLSRYAVINEKFKREILLLVGTGCKFNTCTFCDYHKDVCQDPFLINKAEIDKLTGVYKALDVANSGSCFELDKKTITYLKQKIKELGIHTLWFETHYKYKDNLDDFKKYFPHTKINFILGLETFDSNLHKLWKKQISKNYDIEELCNKYYGVDLLVCTKDQTKEGILQDLEQAIKHFSYVKINVFVNNSTPIKCDEELAKWFKEVVYPKFKDHPKTEFLLHNTDLGIG